MSPDSLAKLVERVEGHYQQRPDDLAFVFARRNATDSTKLTWSRLWQQALNIARALPSSVDTKPFGVLLFCQNEENFVPSLLAVWMKGGVAIPGSGSVSRHIVERNAHILSTARPDIILHDLSDAKLEVLRPLVGEAQLLHVETLLAVNRETDAVDLVAGGGLLQFTSGTTSKPKAIRLSQSAIASNCRAIAQAYNLTEHSVGVSWLPLYHDMGLVGGVLSAFWAGGLSVLQRPFQFVQDPMSWFTAISDWRATTTAAPNFAYARLLQTTTEPFPDGLDLSCLQNVIVGGEPVQKDTMDGLIARFGPAGLSCDALAPSYGLAEATLLVSSGKRTGGPIYAQINGGREVTSLGSVVPGLNIEIMQDGQPCDEGQVGDIVLSGVSMGHIIPFGQDWRLEKFAGQAGPVSTGDFGFCRDGEIYITGRNANKIIIRGKNIFAEDIEAITAQTVPEAVPSGVVAFGVEQDETETVCLLIEMPKLGAFQRLLELNSNVGTKLGVKLGRIVILMGACLPRTSSGKIKRSEARALLLSGALDRRIQEDVRQSHH